MTQADPSSGCGTSSPPATTTETLIWLGHNHAPGEGLYQVPMWFEIDGPVDPDRFSGAFAELVEAEPALRTVFADSDGCLNRNTIPVGAAEPHLEIVSQPPDLGPEWIARESQRVTLDPRQCPYRAILVPAASAGTSHFLLILHHLVCDSLTFTLLLDRLGEIYLAMEEKRSWQPPGWPTFDDDAQLEQRQALPPSPPPPSGSIDPSHSPCNFYSAPVSSPGHRTTRIEQKLPVSMTSPKRLDAAFTDATTLLTALFAYLFRIGVQPAPTIGVTVSLRTTPRLRNTCGPLVQLLPLQLQVDPAETLQQLRSRVSESLRSLLIGARPGDNASSSQRGFDVVFNMVTNHFEAFAGRPVTTRWLHSGAMESHQRLHLNIHDYNNTGTWRLATDFNLDIFPEPWQREAFFHHYFAFLAAAGSQTIAGIDIAGDPAGLSVLSAPQLPPPPSPHLDQAIVRSAKDHPGRPAVVAGETTLSYTDLDALSADLAARISATAEPGSTVAIALPKGPDAVIAILAALRASCTFVPLPPDTPPARAAYILEECNIATAVVGPSPPEWISPSVTSHPTRSLRELLPPPDICRTDDRAYLLYTSGSTGHPKGVVCRHSSVWNLLLTIEERAPLQPSSIGFWWTSITFDVSIYEIFSALCFGRTLYVPDQPTRLDANACIDAIDRARVSSAYLPKSHLQTLLPALRNGRCKSLQRLLVGVEPIPAQLLSQLASSSSHLVVINGYGPTETTVCATLYTVPTTAPSPNQPAPIGGPVAATHTVVVTPDGTAVPLGVTGELWIGGGSLAVEYKNQPGLTSDQFLETSIPGIATRRFYRTGDLVRQLPSGGLQFIGRTDAQLKWNGVRIEPAELQRAIEAVTGASESLATIHRQSLVAFISAVPNFDEAKSLASLADHLPVAMIPQQIISIQQLPRTQNGKIDRDTLVDNYLDSAPVPAGSTSPTETRLCEICTPLLPRVTVTPRTHFLKAGGDSLDAMRLAAEISRAFDAEIGMDTILGHPVLSDLAAAIDRAGESKQQIPPLAEGQHQILAPNQKPLYAASLANSASSAYNVVSAYRLTGDLDTAAVSDAFQAITSRHTPLRTSFANGGTAPVPVVHPGTNVGLEVIDCVEGDLESRAQLECRTPFSLDRAPLVRLLWLSEKSPPTRGILMLIAHHLVIDEWSIDLFWRELETTLQGEDTPPTPEINYAAYAAWQTSKLTSDRAGLQRTFWRDTLASPPPPTTFSPLGPGAVPHRDSGALTDVILLGTGETSALKTQASDAGLTLFPVVVLALSELLRRYTGGSDLILASPVTSRQSPDLADLIGFFLVTLPLRIRLADRTTVGEALHRVGKSVADALRNRDIPLDQILAAAPLGHAPSAKPIPTAVVFAGARDGTQSRTIAGLEAQPAQFDTGTAKFDLTLFAYESQHGLNLQLEFREAVIDRNQAEAILDSLHQLLHGFTNATGRLLTEIPHWSPDNQPHTIARSQGQQLSPFPASTVTAQILAQAATSPEKIALRENARQVTYQELDRRSSAVAAGLSQRLTDHSPVGIHLPRNIDAIIAIIGVLRAGCAYVPLDPNFPQQRLQDIIAAAGVKIAISSSDSAAQLPANSGFERVCFDQLHSTAEPPADLTSLDSTAYILFTSGSSGRPKGVVVSHANLAASTAARSQYYGENPARFLLLSSLGFDSSVASIFWTLATGGTLVPMPHRQEQDIAGLASLISEQKITHTLCLPTVYAALLAHADPRSLQSLKSVIVAGESCSPGLVERHHHLLPHTSLYNEYGPTEATVWATAQELIPGRPTVPIGTPVPGAQVYLLDPSHRPVQIGAIGEIAIGGHGVTAGYVGEENLTTKNFIPNPFNPGKNNRLYLTGDLGRWLPDRTLEFLGRRDRQVKINGQRIELAEIDAALSSHPAVGSAATVVHQPAETGAIIAALSSLEPTEASALLDDLSVNLPPSP